MTTNHTNYNALKINEHLNLHSTTFAHLPTYINSYEEFAAFLPPITGDDINAYMIDAINNKSATSCTFAVSSGTTGEPKLFANASWRDKRKETYAASFKDFMSTHVISKEDVVANLFAAGEFSTLFDGCNRLLESIGASILPIGRLSGNIKQNEMFLKLMKKLGATVLMGTPLSIMQILELCNRLDITLDIKKIIFTGEVFSQSKRTQVMKCWHDVKIFGLYGHSETGFIGIQTPQCDSGTYHLFQDWYFVECCNEEVLVTDLVNQTIPIFRYKVGDKGKLCDKVCSCNIKLPLLELYGRTDAKFNIAGYLMSSQIIQNVVNAFFLDAVDMQIQIRSDASGFDRFSIVIGINNNHLSECYLALMSKITEIEYIQEVISREVAKIELLSEENFIRSTRQKTPMIVDLR